MPAAKHGNSCDISWEVVYSKEIQYLMTLWDMKNTFEDMYYCRKILNLEL